MFNGNPELYFRKPLIFHPETTASTARELPFSTALPFPKGRSYAQLTLKVSAGWASSCISRLPGYWSRAMVKLFAQVTNPKSVSPPENRRLALICRELYLAWPTGSATPPGKAPPKNTPLLVVTPVYCGYGLNDWYTVLAPRCDTKLA